MPLLSSTPPNLCTCTYISSTSAVRAVCLCDLGVERGPARRLHRRQQHRLRVSVPGPAGTEPRHDAARDPVHHQGKKCEMVGGGGGASDASDVRVLLLFVCISLNLFEVYTIFGTLLLYL